eukprot:4467902-Prorocentrum_lima.AAC.1
MTSSLVGSEMCIRDRKRNGEERIQEWIGSAVPEGGLATKVRSAPEPKPVSYTHLTLPTICSV